MEEFRWHPGWKGRYFIILAALGLGVFAWFRLAEDPERWVVWILVFGCALGMVECTTIIDPGHRRFLRRWKWLNRIPLWSREEGLDAFEAVTLRQNRKPRPGDPVFLVLVRVGGRFSRVGYFPMKAAPGKDAAAAASRLSKAAGLPLADYPLRLSSAPVPGR